MQPWRNVYFWHLERRGKEGNRKCTQSFFHFHTKMTWTQQWLQNLSSTFWNSQSNEQEFESHSWLPSVSQVCIQTCTGFIYSPPYTSRCIIAFCNLGLFSKPWPPTLSNKGTKLKKLFSFYSLLIFIFSDVLEQFFKRIRLTLISWVWREDFTFISFALVKKI